MFGLGAQELIIILIIVVILFGASRLPELGKGIGQAIKNFKKATSEPDEIDVTPKKPVEQEKTTTTQESSTEQANQQQKG
ncbi:MAG: twin-arginine translocase TatA/TatE family subunit [Nitrospirae bacterium]|nr:twin-arginine translocase TatA/TatE family subunit [Nitrospirota bacterium]